MTNVIDVEPVHIVHYDNSILTIYHLNKGEGIMKHTHDYTHLTLCQAGLLVIRKENIEKVIDKNSTPINLKENEWHEIEALEDGTVLINLFTKDKY